MPGKIVNYLEEIDKLIKEKKHELYKYHINGFIYRPTIKKIIKKFNKSNKGTEINKKLLKNLKKNNFLGDINEYYLYDIFLKKFNHKNIKIDPKIKGINKYNDLELSYYGKKYNFEFTNNLRNEYKDTIEKEYKIENKIKNQFDKKLNGVLIKIENSNNEQIDDEKINLLVYEIVSKIKELPYNNFDFKIGKFKVNYNYYSNEKNFDLILENNGGFIKDIFGLRNSIKSKLQSLQLCSRNSILFLNANSVFSDLEDIKEAIIGKIIYNVCFKTKTGTPVIKEEGLLNIFMNNVNLLGIICSFTFSNKEKDFYFIVNPSKVNKTFPKSFYKMLYKIGVNEIINIIYFDNQITINHENIKNHLNK